MPKCVYGYYTLLKACLLLGSQGSRAVGVADVEEGLDAARVTKLGRQQAGAGRKVRRARTPLVAHPGDPES